MISVMKQRCLCIAAFLLTCSLVLRRGHASATLGKRNLKGQVSSGNFSPVVRGAEEIEKPAERVCERSETPKMIQFKCKTKTGTGSAEGGNEEKIKDELKFKIKSSPDGAVVEVQYEQEIKSNDMETESETKYEIEFGSIIEYAKNRTDDSMNSANVEDEAYDYEKDEVVQTLHLSDWLDFSEITVDSDGNEFHFNLTSSDGMVSFGFTVSQAYPSAEDGDGDSERRLSATTGGDSNSVISGATANKMKIDFMLTSFPWMHNDTNVALLAKVESMMKMETEYEESTAENDDNEETTDNEDTTENEDTADNDEETDNMARNLNPDGDTDPEEDPEADPETDPETDGEADVASDGEADPETDPETDEETDVEADGETDAEAGGDGDGNDEVDEKESSKKKSKKPKEVRISFQDAMNATGVIPFGELTWATEAMAVPDTSLGDDTDIITSPGNTEVMSQPLETDGEVGEEAESGYADGEGSDVGTLTASKMAADALPIRVVATSPAPSESDNVQHLAFSFVGGEGWASRHASMIAWDPQAGVAYEEVGTEEIVEDSTGDGNNGEPAGDNPDDTSESSAVSSYGLSVCTVFGVTLGMLATLF